MTSSTPRPVLLTRGRALCRDSGQYRCDHGQVDIRDLLAQRALPVAISPHSTSYFSAPRPTLDPTVFDGMHMRPEFRRAQLSDVLRFLADHWRHPEKWSRLWLAGSSASYQWSGAMPADMDLLIGIDYDTFRAANPGFGGISNTEISAYLNRMFQDFDSIWQQYDRTLYSNPNATDIHSINPYAAYDITNDDWTVPPDADLTAPDDPALRERAALFDARAAGAVHGYSAARDAYNAAVSDAERLNAAVRLKHSADVASSLYEEVHTARKAAFRPGGGGYLDPSQYLWQASKASGSNQALRAIHDERRDVYDNPAAETDRVLIEAALYRRSR